MFILGGLVLGLYSCDNKDEATPTLPYDNGVIVVNEGNFTDNNGTLSLIERGTQNASYDIFFKENAKSFAGILTGYAEVNGKGIVLVDNSTAGRDVIEIVNAGTFKSETTIPSSEIENPRNVLKVSETKAYVTAWDVTGGATFYSNPGYVAVLDLVSNKITKKIPVENGAENIVIIGNEAFVGSVGGKTTISVLDIATDAVKQTIEVGASPNVIGVDVNNKLLVYAGSQLKKVNVSSKAVEGTITITSPIAGLSPSKFTLSKDKKTIIFTLSGYDANWTPLGGQTYSGSVDATTIAPSSPFINKIFYGTAVDPETGQIYAGLAPSFKQAGYVFRYQPNGTLVDSVKAEIAPAKFFFKR